MKQLEQLNRPQFVLVNFAIMLFCAALGLLVNPFVPASKAQQLSAPQPASFQTLTVGTTAGGLAAATINPTDGKGVVQRCTGVVETNPVRMRSYGGLPTATVGVPAAVGSNVTLDGYAVIAAWQAIRDTTASGDATIHMECYRELR